MGTDESIGVKRSRRLQGVRDLDSILRGDLTRLSSLREGRVEVAPGRLSRVIVVLCMIHGLCMATFTVFSRNGPALGQVVATMVKVPLLFYLTLIVTLPSLYVFNALVGSRLTFSAVVRLLVATLGVNVAVLCSMGPIVAFFSVSTTSYPFMVLFNVVVFAIAGGLAQMFLLQTLQRLSIAQTLIEAEPDAPGAETPSAIRPLSDQFLGRHVKTIFRLWLVVFGLVGAQMGWVLRPFIGNPNVPFTWFRGRQSNFFEAVLHTLGSLLS
ncbi:hypothetical protein [Paludisphaera borealis]|uniref:Actin-binding WH2 domain-containing protein n=1 Tax=Paludisphaera borealis TaxID=1387353 RepID=A0A1U7CY55_9BACT|nr:hypothetical protein [Paludisphaera borealis]APW63882.1 hypothetical protein BSF38_05468 [Paludisphaera borealis]